MTETVAPPPLRRILYVEDEPDVQLIARFALERVGGFELRVCSSGDEALLAVDDFAPDLLLLDVMMPRMDGPATLAALRRKPQTATTPAVFMTAKTQDERLRQADVADVIVKPFEPMTLPDTVRAIWARIHAPA
jgi:CheY-like chemotaxis protein